MQTWLARSFALRSAVLGLGAGLIARIAGMDAFHAALLGWCVHVVGYIALLYARLWRASPEDMKCRAARLAERRLSILLFSLCGAAVSLGAVVWKIALGGGGWPEMALAVVTVLLSWAYVQALFAQDYANHYWRTGGGVEFPGGDGTPEFSEFVYLALNVGVAFQVSDTPTSTPSMRRLVALHGVVAFAFNAVILAATIEMLGNLGEG
jgi:uncharacterized membrane protein